VRVRAASAICAAVALVACAWFALGARQAIDTQRATAIVSQGRMATIAQERKVSSLVHAARFLNPDREPDLLLATAELEHGEQARARRLFESVARSEPQNLEAWVGLAEASSDNRALYAYALGRVRALEPRLPTR
jgi:hypothetical protein